LPAIIDRLILPTTTFWLFLSVISMQAVDYLKELIPFSSVSSESNSDITDRVAEWLAHLGFETERINYCDENGVKKSCIQSRKGPASGCGVAYFCHTDVVPVNSWSFPKSGPWTPLVADGRIYGRGSCDMKGSLCCMLAAAEALRSTPLKAPLYFIATADEEIGMPGARKVVEQSAIYREIVASQTRSIIGEPTRLEIVHAHKGGRAIRATSVGRAAHSSTGLGVNANIALIPFLNEIGNIQREMETSQEWRDERFSPPTPSLNIVIKDTNTALNITSAKSECLVYFRPMPGQQADGMVKRIKTLAESKGLQFELLFAGNPLYTDPQTPFIRELLKLTSLPASRTVAYGTDGAVFTELGNIAVFGPGDIAQAHTDDEWIALDQLEKGTALYQQAIRRWCC
jgi:acetylornithine deacetylase